MDALEFLYTRVPLFAGLTEETLLPLAKDSALKEFAAGQTVVHAGMSVEQLHVVAVGSVGIHAKIPNKGVQQVAELKSGEVFGEASMVEGSLAGATVKAGEQGAVILLIPEEPFRALYAGSPEFHARLDALIASRRPPTKSTAA
ncbi:MAG: cyclic nucleotide-binding domain-containing protein [Elusimicrobia bacterium]|nr:cyclic nucleotide-binding domain-containing protein [Elusimicrobiota bacterium]